ncbi:MAG: CAP domain-containing protein [Sporomusaceae bacterium]|nr:CAP domain-containing protein [Sporomusaceae bacterium]
MRFATFVVGMALLLAGACSGYALAGVLLPPETAPAVRDRTALPSAGTDYVRPASVIHKKAPPAAKPDRRTKAAEQRAFELLNADRRANGLPPLRLNGSLVVLAEAYARDMIERDYFSHYNPEGQSPFDRMKAYGLDYRYAGENLAIHHSIEAAQQELMNSPGHRANILGANYSEVGIGVCYDSRGSLYVVQEFIGH